jgi:hypothetical protein
MNDNQLSDALKIALLAKKERLDRLRTLHAASSHPKPLDDSEANKPLPIDAGRRAPLKRSVPQRSKAKTGK